MTPNNSINRIVEIIQKNKAGSIVFPPNPSIDCLATATSLYLALTKLGKTISLTCSNQLTSDLFAVDKIQSTLGTGGSNLVISFPYSDGSVDKVDYNIQNNQFNLIVIPQSGQSKLNPNQVKYSYSGGEIDFIITIDTPTLKALGSIYEDNQNRFQGVEIINIDRHLTNTNFGTINFVDKTSSSSSEMALKIIKSLSIEIDKEIATNLYRGITTATNNFSSYSVNAKTLENSALLLKKGAIKKPPTQTTFGLRQQPYQPRATQPTTSRMTPNQPMISQTQPIRNQIPTNNQPRIQNTRPINPQSQPSDFQNTKSSTIPSANEKQTVKPIDSVEKEPLKDTSPPPKDWLKPKIFRGKGLI